MNRVTWSLVALAGACGGPPTPQPARLDPATAASITARLAGGRDRFCPGGAAPQLDVAVATTAGKVLDSWTQGEHRDGKLPFSTFEFTTSWGQIDGDGFVRLPDDPQGHDARSVVSVFLGFDAARSVQRVERERPVWVRAGVETRVPQSIARDVPARQRQHPRQHQAAVDHPRLRERALFAVHLVEMDRV